VEQINEFMEKIDALSVRERGLILAGIVLALYLIWDILLMQPLANREQRILSELESNKAEQTALNINYEELIRQLQSDPEGENRERLESLRYQLDDVESDLRASTDFLISPDNMADVLRTILSKSNELQLVEMKGLGAKPLLDNPDETDAQDTADVANTMTNPQAMGELSNVYKHGLKIVFEGNYAATLNFMKEIEVLEWGFFWENLDYEVIEYPTGRAALTLYTLSLDENWIGV
jgi:MSHA biogenesis protein MshJ